MDDQFEKLFGALHEKLSVKAIVSGKATDITDSTCRVIREGQPDLIDVRLNAVVDNLDTSLTVKPKDGSYVLCGIIEGAKTEAVILVTGEIDSIRIKIGAMLFEMVDGKFSIIKGNDGLGKCIDDLILEIQQIVAPKNSAAITLIQNRFKAFLHG